MFEAPDKRNSAEAAMFPNALVYNKLRPRRRVACGELCSCLEHRLVSERVRLDSIRNG